MKAVTLYRPSILENAFHDFDRYMESFFGESPLAPATRVFSYMPAVDIQEREDAYMLEAELPGYDEKSIQVHVDGNTLTIESKQEEESQREVSENPEGEKKERAYVIRERRMGFFPEKSETSSSEGPSLPLPPEDDESSDKMSTSIHIKPEPIQIPDHHHNH